MQQIHHIPTCGVCGETGGTCEHCPALPMSAETDVERFRRFCSGLLTGNSEMLAKLAAAATEFEPSAPVTADDVRQMLSQLAPATADDYCSIGHGDDCQCAACGQWYAAQGAKIDAMTAAD